LISRADRHFVTERADSRCEYCRAPQIVTGVTFHIEHISPRTRGGIDDRANYALTCVTCNGHKSDHNAGVDPETGVELPIFHPPTRPVGSAFPVRR
jgi:5-methylcytosine-specific restriction endonuclease McrA